MIETIGYAITSTLNAAAAILFRLREKDKPEQNTVYRVDREGVCYPPQRKVVLKGRKAEKGS